MKAVVGACVGVYKKERARETEGEGNKNKKMFSFV